MSTYIHVFHIYYITFILCIISISNKLPLNANIFYTSVLYVDSGADIFVVLLPACVRVNLWISEVHDSQYQQIPRIRCHLMTQIFPYVFTTSAVRINVKIPAFQLFQIRLRSVDRHTIGLGVVPLHCFSFGEARAQRCSVQFS